MIFGRKRESQKLEVGQDVVTNDEEEFGTVTAVHDDYLEVAAGPMDRRAIWRVPRSAVARVENEVIHLNVSRGQVLAKGWEHRPEASGQDLASTNT